MAAGLWEMTFCIFVSCVVFLFKKKCSRWWVAVLCYLLFHSVVCTNTCQNVKGHLKSGGFIIIFLVFFFPPPPLWTLEKCDILLVCERVCVCKPARSKFNFIFLFLLSHFAEKKWKNNPKYLLWITPLQKKNLSRILDNQKGIDMRNVTEQKLSLLFIRIVHRHSGFFFFLCCLLSLLTHFVKHFCIFCCTLIPCVQIQK